MAGWGMGTLAHCISPIPFPINAMESVAKVRDEAGRPKARSRAGQGFPGWKRTARDTTARISRPVHRDRRRRGGGTLMRIDGAPRG